MTDENLNIPTGNEGQDVSTYEEPKTYDVPEGFDVDVFDTEKGVLKTDKIKERFDSFSKTEEGYKKQVADLRGVISKGTTLPENAEEYSKDYKLSEEYASFYSEEANAETREFLTANAGAIDELSLSLGLNKEQNAGIKNAFHKLMADAGVIEPPLSEEAKLAQEEASKKWREEQYNTLGGVEVVRSTIAHYQNFNILNEAEKKAVMDHMDGDTALISAMNKLRIYTHGESAGSNIPVTHAIGGLADDTSLAREYNHKDTLDSRRMEILQQRVAAGRTGRLPLVD